MRAMFLVSSGLCFFSVMRAVFFQCHAGCVFSVSCELYFFSVMQAVFFTVSWELCFEYSIHDENMFEINEP